MEAFEDDLCCPITADLLEDPIHVPCCGQAFSREALSQHLQRRPVCPLCNQDLQDFNPSNAVRNRTLERLVRTLQNKPPPSKEQKDHEWKATLTPVGPKSDMAELCLSIERAQFRVRPSLFIAVVDRSGSMGGKPERQVRTALHHIVSMAHQNPRVQLIILSFGSDCIEIQTAEQYRIDGGTNFRAAFASLGEVLSRYMYSDEEAQVYAPQNISGVTVAFMTDGEDMTGDKNRLVPDLQEILRRRWEGRPLSFHSIGFGRGCDQVLLEGLRTVGSIEGTYRYADPQDDDDTLCQKLTGVFELSSKASSIPLEITLLSSENNNEEEHKGVTQRVSLALDAQRYGEYRQWVSRSQVSQVRISTSRDQLILDVHPKKTHESLRQRWLSYLTDRMASELLDLSQQQGQSANVREFQCALLRHKLDEMMSHNNDEDNLGVRLRYLESQLDELERGNAVDMARLRDMRFSSLFAVALPAKKKKPEEQFFSTETWKQEEKKIDNEMYSERPLKRYTRNNAKTNRNLLQKAIVDQVANVLTPTMSKMIESSTLEYALFKDENGNNAFHLAAYCGHSEILKALIKRFPQADLTVENNDEETAMTLAIKKRGFHRCVGTLLNAKVNIPRVKSMERFAIENGYKITAQIVGSHSQVSTSVDASMTPEFVEFTFSRIQDGKLEFDAQQFLDVALALRMNDFATVLMTQYAAEPTLDMLVKHCIPPKPDHPETETYLKMACLLLDRQPNLIHETTDPEEESALLMACKKGSLPHVKEFLKRGAKVEQPNEKGNTPFWVASYMRYPCIMEELMKHGADINWKNKKGNVPLYGACERGSRKIAEMLVQEGADVTHINTNGDTLILLCCRNGQFEVLNFLLDYVDDTFVNHKAHIDGFNAIMACAEQNRPECIRVLHEYGVRLDQVTADDNQILARATPLHIACYYGCEKAVDALIQFGAPLDAQDLHGQTPLHIATAQQFPNLIRKLRQAGASTRVKDVLGNTCMAYCRSNEEIRRVLVPPMLHVLMKLARGALDADDEKMVCSFIENYQGVMTRYLEVDVRSFDDSTPLLFAVLWRRLSVIQTLLRVGANPVHANGYGFTPLMAAHWTRNMRVVQLLNPKNRHVVGLLPQDDEVKRLLFLGLPPPYYEESTESGILVRMESFINTPRVLTNTFVAPEHDSSLKFILPTVPVEEKEELNVDVSSLVWEAKIYALNRLVADPKADARHLMTLALFTNNAHVARILNRSLIAQVFQETVNRQYAGALYETLKALPVFAGEVFLGSTAAQRKSFQVGQEFRWNHFLSGSTMWRVALENTPSFTSKNRRGTVFLLKSRTGRHVGAYSPFSFDSEVVILPGTPWKVTAWYHGDPICLGQANIREHTFAVKERDDERMEMSRLIESDKSLIIECTELN